MKHFAVPLAALLVVLCAAGMPLGWYTVHGDDKKPATEIGAFLKQIETLHQPGTAVYLPPAPPQHADRYWIADTYVPRGAGNRGWADQISKLMNDAADNGWEYKEQVAPGYFLFVAKGSKR